MDRMCNGMESVWERCREAIELQRVFAASLRAVLERSRTGLRATEIDLGTVWDRVKRHGKGLESVLERCRQAREPQRVFAVSLRTVLERS